MRLRVSRCRDFHVVERATDSWLRSSSAVSGVYNLGRHRGVIGQLARTALSVAGGRIAKKLAETGQTVPLPVTSRLDIGA